MLFLGRSVDETWQRRLQTVKQVEIKLRHTDEHVSDMRSFAANEGVQQPPNDQSSSVWRSKHDA